MGVSLQSWQGVLLGLYIFLSDFLKPTLNMRLYSGISVVVAADAVAILQIFLHFFTFSVKIKMALECSPNIGP